VGSFVLVVFWVGVCFAFAVLGARVALVFIALWLAGVVLSALFSLQPFLFIAYDAVLSVALFIMLQREWA